MDRFNFKKNELYCEKVALRNIAARYGTPCYVYSMGAFLDQFRQLRAAFKRFDSLICYSMKANSNLTVLKRLVKEGTGVDIVSGGELYKAKRIGVSPKKIVFASVGKTDEEIISAIRYGILCFNVESEEELVNLNRLAAKLNRHQKVALRVNPEVDPDTHFYIATGKKETKFGLDRSTAERLFLEAYRFPHLSLAGIHIHIGSQITKAKPFVDAIKKALSLIDDLKTQGALIESLNIGGGLGITYSNEKPQTPEGFVKVIEPLLKGRGLKIILEPGRFIAGNSGLLVTKLLYWKKSGSKRFAIVDAGMNDLLRPSIYDSYHAILPVHNKSRGERFDKVDVVGPICETGDFLGKGRTLPKLQRGDLLAVKSSGAYGFSMASNYNSRPRVPEIVVSGSRSALTRKRETYSDLLKNEKIVDI